VAGNLQSCRAASAHNRRRTDSRRQRRRHDDRSEETIATLLPEVRPYARALINKAAATGITIKAISGLRTYAEQDELYAKGRTKPGPKVTNASGGHSNHNFGIAFDIGVFEENKWLPESPKYKAVGALGVDLGLEWGGNWTTIVTNRISNCARAGLLI
jgi:peptidoglycan L-alanyl-D-glutamate endopeptidase CwlK